jgi:hypothetical protein
MPAHNVRTTPAKTATNDSRLEPCPRHMTATSAAITRTVGVTMSRVRSSGDISKDHQTRYATKLLAPREGPEISDLMEPDLAA